MATASSCWSELRGLSPVFGGPLEGEKAIARRERVEKEELSP
jgi:hypothetical protein